MITTAPPAAWWANRPATYAWQTSLPQPLNSVPADLLAVAAAMSAGGLLILWPVLRALPETLRLLGDGTLVRDFGLLLLSALLVLGFFGGACLTLAWWLVRGEPAARLLSYVLLGGLAAAIAVGDNHSGTLIVAMLISLAALVVLSFSPHVRAFFAARRGGEPTSVIAARALTMAWAGCVAVIGLLFVPLGDLSAKYVIVGVLALGCGGTAFAYNARLRAGDPTARTVTSALLGFYLVLLVIAGHDYTGIVLPLTVAAGALILLWLPADAQTHFATATAARGAHENA